MSSASTAHDAMSNIANAPEEGWRYIDLFENVLLLLRELLRDRGKAVDSSVASEQGGCSSVGGLCACVLVFVADVHVEVCHVRHFAGIRVQEIVAKCVCLGEVTETMAQWRL